MKSHCFSSILNFDHMDIGGSSPRRSEDGFKTGAKKNRCVITKSDMSVFVIVTQIISSVRVRPDRQNQSKEKANVTVVPLYQVLQPLPLLFILFQLFLPCLCFVRAHSLQEPSLTHGFGLRRTHTYVSCESSTSARQQKQRGRCVFKCLTCPSKPDYSDMIIS